MFAKVWTEGLLTWLCLVALNCVFFYLTRLCNFSGHLNRGHRGLRINLTTSMYVRLPVLIVCLKISAPRRFGSLFGYIGSMLYEMLGFVSKVMFMNEI